jgi:phage-related protein (TIGR01555 family)
MFTADKFENLVSGLGGPKDKAASGHFALFLRSDEELAAMHRGDWLSRKIVDIIPQDMTREWRDWQASTEAIEAIEGVEKALRIQQKTGAALQLGRLFGGAALYMGIRGQDPQQPLEIDRVGKGALEYVHLLRRREVTPGQRIRDVFSPFYGEPEYFEISSSDGMTARVHPSRLVRFTGAPIADPMGDNNSEVWGDSVLQAVYEAIANATSVQSHVAALLPEVKVDVIYIPGLGKMLENASTTEALTKRFAYANTAKSLFNMLLLEGTGDKNAPGERWEQKQINFSNLTEIAQMFLQIVSGAADVPVTRLLGQSPAGLNATGESDLRNYYDNIRARQKNDLSPALTMLDEVLIRSATGSRDPSIYYDWRSLWGMSEAEKADVLKTKAEAMRTIVGRGGTEPALIMVEAASDALVDELIEDGSLAGLEAAIEKYGRLGEQPEDDPAESEAALVRFRMPPRIPASEDLMMTEEPGA